MLHHETVAHCICSLLHYQISHQINYLCEVKKTKLSFYMTHRNMHYLLVRICKNLRVLVIYVPKVPG